MTCLSVIFRRHVPGALLAFGFGLAASVHAADGAHFYAQHCAACHGAEGKGGVGVPLALPDFLAQADDDYLRTTIRHGRPGRVMPAFAQITDAEVEAIVGYLRALAPAGAKPVAVKAKPGNAARGAGLYEKRCASCHGAHGEGGHGTGVTFSRPRDLPVLAPALNNPGFLKAASDDFIKTVLMRGRRGTPMSSFLKQGLTERDIDDIVAHVRGFAAQPPPASAKLLETESAVIVRESPYDVAQTVDKLKTAFSGANLRVIRAVPYDEGIVEKGRENQKRWIVDACDFNFLNQALAVDPRVGLFLPCRVTVAEHQGKVLVLTINPKRLSAIFNNAELNELCEQMQKLYTDIIEETVL
ncbi:MAG: cytochrome C [Candidatus Muproteobacteria bacterium RBG_16_64_11]|uniref:Cytochrome C n=1 Tax=Candidatus Muproteobacteria bacterium RBG_16_64_11 TaxID=1817758 RepID=A0A1F6T9S5_9PROT|nr:MAG: cytochrome C [Candidatus Muproteobacteria bacterium RBG_16_64_11]